MFLVKVVTPHGVYGETEATILNVTTPDGVRGILSNHMPIVTPITVGKMSLGMEGDSYSYRYNYATGSGVLYFRNNFATVLVDEIARADEIEVDEVLVEKEQLEMMLQDRKLEEHVRERLQKDLDLVKIKLKVAEMEND